MKDPKAAARRRESLRATNRMTNRQLAIVLKEASQEAAQAAQYYAARPGIGAATRAAQLRLIAQEQRRISSALWNRVGELTQQGMREQATLAARHGVALDALVGMPVNQIVGYAEGMVFNAQQAAETVIARRNFGRTLSERIFTNGRRGAQAATSIVERGLAQGLSSRELAAQVRSFYSPNVPGGQSHAAMRLARTEINTTYHKVQQEQAAGKPWVDGMQWTLSGSHPEPDICDELAEADVDKLGAGVYKSQSVPDLPHPHCLCYLATVTVSPEVFNQRLLTGQYDSWLQDEGFVGMGAVA